MSDVIMLAFVIVCFALVAAYASLCKQLLGPLGEISPHDADRLGADSALRRHCRPSDASVGRLSGAGLYRSAHVFAVADRSRGNRALSSAGIKPQTEQSWYGYTISFLVFHAAGIIALYGLLRLQAVLPLNPQAMTAVAPDLALNTAVSFVTNTSWQSYSGETTLSYLSQMAGITVQ